MDTQQTGASQCDEMRIIITLVPERSEDSIVNEGRCHSVPEAPVIRKTIQATLFTAPCIPHKQQPAFVRGFLAQSIVHRPEPVLANDDIVFSKQIRTLQPLNRRRCLFCFVVSRTCRGSGSVQGSRSCSCSSKRCHSLATLVSDCHPTPTAKIKDNMRNATSYIQLSVRLSRACLGNSSLFATKLEDKRGHF